MVHIGRHPGDVRHREYVWVVLCGRYTGGWLQVVGWVDAFFSESLYYIRDRVQSRGVTICVIELLLCRDCGVERTGRWVYRRGWILLWWHSVGGWIHTQCVPIEYRKCRHVISPKMS